MNSNKYDSEAETRKHIMRVGCLMVAVANELASRASVHDASKLLPPEKEAFDEMTQGLKGSTYGSEEYKGFLAAMKPALDHHYANNRHHPEHYECGINGMDLIDLLEMLCDWKAATERHADGDLLKSIEINSKRFGVGNQLAEILINTATNSGFW